MGYSAFQAGRHGIVESPAWPVREAMIGVYFVRTAWEARERARAAKKER